MPEIPEGQNSPASGSPEWLERYSRQTLLKGVGVEGQKKWANSRVRVIGEGPALEACLTALASSGAGTLWIGSPEPYDLQALSQNQHQAKTDLLADIGDQSDSDLTLVVTERTEIRRRISRQLRKLRKTGIFAWPAASGFALWVGTHAPGPCPCLECFEVLNPKAFTHGTPMIQRLLGQVAASEGLLYLLKGESPLAQRVWITALDTGISLHHEVFSSYKCPAQLEDEGASHTP